MSIESPDVLSHLTSWLTCIELCSMRTLNRNLRTVIPQHTWELNVNNVCNSRSISHLFTEFPHVWCLRMQDTILEKVPTMESLVPWLDTTWNLRELRLTRVTSFRGFYVYLIAEELTKVTIRECYQVQEPAIVAPNLEILIIEYCPLTKLHADTSLPKLKTLRLSSHKFKTLQLRHLIKRILSGSPVLGKLSLAGCSQLEQVLVERGDLPSLRQLDLNSCASLTRVHVTSEMLESINVSHNDNLQYMQLNLDHVVDLDLSFLKSLSHLYIRSPSLRRLNLRGCSQVVGSNTCVCCPNLQFVVLQGTSIGVNGFNKTTSW